MVTKLRNNEGRIVEIQEKGETVWKDEDYIQRPKIGDKTAQMLRDAENLEDIKAYLGRIHNIELEKEASK